MWFGCTGELVEIELLDGSKVVGLVEDEDEHFIKVAPRGEMLRSIIINKERIALIDRPKRMRPLLCGIWRAVE